MVELSPHQLLVADFLHRSMNIKEFTRSMIQKACPPRSECKTESDRKYFSDLFETDWEVFVVKADKSSGKFRWSTACCVEASFENR